MITSVVKSHLGPPVIQSSNQLRGSQFEPPIVTNKNVHGVHDFVSFGDQTATGNTPRVLKIPILPNVPTYTSTPYCAAGNIPSNKTFGISPMAPLVSNTQDVATIVAEVSAAAAAQALKEFHRMCEPKITKLKGG